jgi:hypothetical protein
MAAMIIIMITSSSSSSGTAGRTEAGFSTVLTTGDTASSTLFLRPDTVRAHTRGPALPSAGLLDDHDDRVALGLGGRRATELVDTDHERLGLLVRRVGASLCAV